MKITILITLLFIITSCDNNPKSTSNIKIDVNDLSQSEFLNFYQLETIIPLELLNNSVFDSEYVEEFIFADNKLFVSVDEGKDIKVFNISGKYLYTIDRSGNGPQEYGLEYKALYLIDSSLLVRNFEGEMIYYDMKGNFITRHKNPLDQLSFQVGVLPDGNFISNREMNGVTAHLKDTLIEKSPYYSVNIYSRNGELLKQLLEREKYISNVYVITSKKGFYNDGNIVWFAPLYDNKIYKYTSYDTTLSAMFQINVEGANFNTDIKSTNTTDGALKFLNRKGAFSILVATPKYFILEIQGDKNKIYWAFIQKHTNTAEIFNKNNIYDKTNNIPIKKIIPSNLHGKIVTQLEYNHLIDKEGKLIDSHLTRTISQKVEINEEMNPVLCIYKEK